MTRRQANERAQRGRGRRLPVRDRAGRRGGVRVRAHRGRREHAPQSVQGLAQPERAGRGQGGRSPWVAEGSSGRSGRRSRRGRRRGGRTGDLDARPAPPPARHGAPPPQPPPPPPPPPPPEKG